jgi:hypothetical protein
MSFLQLYKDYREGGKHHCTVSDEDMFDEFPCFHCDLANDDCLCGQPEQQGNKCPFCVVRELNQMIKDADEMAPAVAEGEGLFHVLTCANTAECPTVSPLMACMDALLIARYDLLTSASAWNLPPMDFAKAVMKEVADLLYLPMTSGRDPCGVAGCCCFLNPLRELVVAELMKDPYLTGDLERMGVLAEGNTEDVRVLTGTLTCVDPQANLVLAEAVTLADDGGGGGGKDHPVGTVIVPAAQRASVGLEVEAHEERAWRDAVAGV